MKRVTIGVVALAVLAAAWIVTHRGPKAGPLGRPFQGGMECLSLGGHQVMAYGALSGCGTLARPRPSSIR
jgi:hypothetical protein